MPKVSIIVPVYNVEEYISKCLDSIVNQTFKDIEIICVNDGATDNSCQILEEYLAKDNRIKIITQKNGGLFAARHTGMSYASGEYTLFIDSDDWIDTTLVQKSVEQITKNDADVVIFGAYSVKGNSIVHGMYSTKKIKSKFKNNVFSIKNFENNIFSFAPTAWNKLYRTSFLKQNNIRFQEIRNGEDQLFYIHTMLCAEKICILDEDLYYYVKNRAGAITATSQKKSISPILNFYAAEQLLKSLNVNDKFINQIINRYFSKALSWYSKCAPEIEEEYFEELLKLKKYLDENYPQNWWKHFKVRKNEKYYKIKVKIITAKFAAFLKGK